MKMMNFTFGEFPSEFAQQFSLICAFYEKLISQKIKQIA